MPESEASDVGATPHATRARPDGDRRKPAIIGSVVLAVILFIALALAATVAWSERGCGGCHQFDSVSQMEAAHKGTACWECHRSSGRLEVIARPLRVTKMGVGWLLSRSPATPRLDSGACSSCHEKQMRMTVQTSDITVRHLDFLEGAICQECHAEHAPLTVVPVLDKCATCHNGVDADNSCDTCHVGAVPAISASSGWMASVHVVKDTPTHGVASFETCPMCHAAAMCARCHETSRLPHGSGPDWQLEHGAAAKSDDRGCLTCHRKRQCDSCHDLPMPHPDGWLPDHSGQATRRGSKPCYTCHAPQDCDRCHFRHIHPYGFDKKQAPR